MKLRSSLLDPAFRLLRALSGFPALAGFATAALLVATLQSGPHKAAGSGQAVGIAPIGVPRHHMPRIVMKSANVHAPVRS